MKFNITFITDLILPCLSTFANSLSKLRWIWPPLGHQCANEWMSTKLSIVSVILVHYCFFLLQKFSQSVDFLASWKHPHVIRFQGIGGGRTPLLIMEYALYGTLDKYLKKNKHMLKLSHQLTAAVQIINALDYLVSSRFYPIS